MRKKVRKMRKLYVIIYGCELYVGGEKLDIISF